jgi:protein SCO1/2
MNLRRPRRATKPSTDLSARRAAARAAAALAVALAGCRSAPLPVLGSVPPFTLTERSGRSVGSADLAGRVWVADFIFTRCPDVCPLLTARMAELGRRLPAGPDRIQLVSFSVDPAHDTPEVLRDYAARMGAGDGWLFLTGPREAIAGLLRQGFKVAFADDGPPAAPITHSDRFVLVDRHLRIRGYYHGNDPADLERLARDARALDAERPS